MAATPSTLSSGKTIGIKGKVLHSQARELIANVLEFFKQEATDGITIPLVNFKERLLAATKISEKTYRSVKKQSSEIKTGQSKTFSTPHKERSPISRKSGVPLGEIETIIRNIIHKYYLIGKRRPFLKGILAKMNECGLSFSGGLSTLRTLIMSMGFKWTTTKDKRKILMESYDIRLKRIQFLKEFIKYREEGRPIIYTDETYLHSSHTQPKGWDDGSMLGLKKPIGKGQRLIIVLAGGKMGFIPGALLIFRSGTKSGDYHDEMNHDNFMKWVKQQLLPNMPPRSVLVVDNASYHNVA